VDGPSERSRPVPAAGVCAELRLLSRAAILHVYGVELHNLSPSSISQAAIFAAVCKGYLGIAPHWDLWTHLFSVELFASSTGERRVRMAVRAGGCIL
jgi:hypothetical protein